MRRLWFACVSSSRACPASSCRLALKQPLKDTICSRGPADSSLKGDDFLAIIDADPDSPAYGELMTTLARRINKRCRIHHTEYVMPASGMLFANDHDVGRTFIFDLNDTLHPKIVTSFTDMDGYMHPHSFVRLPNGHVLATFQHAHHGSGAQGMGATGGLVEIDDGGKVVRSASNADPALPDALLMPYGLVVLADEDRVVSTNSSMHMDDLFSGVTYQIWRLSDLKLLKTAYFDGGDNHYGQVEPRKSRGAHPTARFSCRRSVAGWSGSRASPAAVRKPHWSTLFRATGAAFRPSSGIISSRACRPFTVSSSWTSRSPPPLWKRRDSR